MSAENFSLNVPYSFESQKKQTPFKIGKITPSLKPYQAIGIATNVFGTLNQKDIFLSSAVLASSLIDESIASHVPNAKHFITRTIIFQSMLYKPWADKLYLLTPNQKLAIAIGSYVLGGITSYFTDDFLEYKNKLGIPLESFFTINKIFSNKNFQSMQNLPEFIGSCIKNPQKAFTIIKNDLFEVVQNKFLTNSFMTSLIRISEVYINDFYTKKLGSYGENAFVTTFLTEHKDSLDYPKKIMSEILKIITIMFGKNIYTVVKSAYENYLSFEFSKIIAEKYSNILLKGENIEKIEGKNRVEGKRLLDNLENDISIVANGAKNLVNFATDNIQLSVAINNFKNLAPDVLAPYMGINLLLQVLIDKIKPALEDLKKQKSYIDGKYTRLKSSVIDNFRKINGANFGNGKKFLEESLVNIQEKNAAVIIKIQPINAIIDLFFNIQDLLVKVADALYFGFNIKIMDSLQTKEYFAKIPTIKNAKEIILWHFISNKVSQIHNLDNNLALERINKVFDLINSSQTAATKISYAGKNIIFKNYALNLEESNLVKIPFLEISPGIYLVSGKAGCGKSSALKDLATGVSGALNSSGEIFIPENSKILYLGKDTYQIPDATLLEIICFPINLKKLSELEKINLEKFVISLLRELEIDEFSRDHFATKGIIANINTEEFNLSDGQKQKIAIIQAILSNPNILVLDETFNSLDEKKSLPLVKEVLKKHFKGICFIVDHGGDHHNDDQFCKAELKFADHQVTYKHLDNNDQAFNTEIHDHGPKLLGDDTYGQGDNF